MASEGGEPDLQMCVRKRKCNFSSVETAVLVEKYEEHKVLLDSKLTNQLTNIKKCKLWEEITQAVNSVGNASRTTDEIRAKWKGLKKAAKKACSFEISQARKTGGGPAEKSNENTEETPVVLNKIVDMYRQSSSFVGVDGGLEAGVPVAEGVNGSASADDSQLGELQICEDKPEIKFSQKTTYTTKKSVTQHDVLCKQFDVLKAQEENLLLEKEKLKLQIQLLEEHLKQTKQIQPYSTVNLSPIFRMPHEL